jgi:hypothetical protein
MSSLGADCPRRRPKFAVGGDRTSLGKVAGATTNLARVVAGLGRTGKGGVASRQHSTAWVPAASADGRQRLSLAGRRRRGNAEETQRKE